MAKSYLQPETENLRHSKNSYCIVSYVVFFFLNSITLVFYAQFDFALLSNEEPENNYFYGVIFQRYF